MDLLSNLNEAQWRTAEPSSVTGLADYTILKSKFLEVGKFEYALQATSLEGDLIIGVLEGGQGKRNPLQQARNVEMKVVGGKIVAINLEGDCVVKK